MNFSVGRFCSFSAAPCADLSIPFYRHGQRDRLQSPKEDSRARHRSRSRRDRRDCDTHRTSYDRDENSRRSRFEDNLPSGWQPSATHYDTNQEYSLTLPRQIQSTQFSRKQGYAGQDIMDVKVVEVVQGGMSNWSLRLLANGRFASMEMFRTKLESIFASTMFKELYRMKNEVDLPKIILSKCGDTDDWNKKHEVIKQLVLELINHLKTHMPVDQGQQMMDELETLRQENARLRSQNVGMAPAAATGPGHSATGSPGLNQYSHRSPVPSPTPEVEPLVQGPLDQYRRRSDQHPSYATHAPESHTKGKIDAWIRKYVPRQERKNVDSLITQIKQEFESVSAGGRPNVEAILCDWGLSSQLLSKCSLENQFRLLAAVQLVKS